MRLHLNKTLRAALIAAITTVGLTLTQAQAEESNLALFNLSADTLAGHAGATSVSVTQGSVTLTISTSWAQGLGSGTTSYTTFNVAGVSTDLLNTNAMVTDGSIADTYSTFVSAGAKNDGADLTITLSGLNAGGKYDVSLVSGITFEGAGSWSDINTTNAFTSSVDMLGNDKIQAKSLSGFAVVDMVADSDGCITFTINDKGAHTAVINGIAIAGAPYVPPTDLTWAGTEQDHVLTSSVWDNGQTTTAEYSATDPLIFGADGWKEVTVATATTANSLTVQEGEYTLDASAAALTATKITVDTGATLTIKGTVEVGGSVSAADAGSLIVSEGATLKANAAATAKSLLTADGVANSGTVEIGADVTVDSSLTSKLGGTVAVASGKKLTLGTTKDSHSIDLTSLDALVLGQGANIDSKALKVDIKNLTANGSTLNMLDTKDKNQVGVDLHGTTNLVGDLTITSGWKYKINIEKLVGSGSLELTGGNEEHRAVIGDVSINSLTVTNKMTNVDITGTVALSGALAVNGTTNVTGQNAMTVGGLTGSAALNVANGITFDVAEGGNYSYTGTLTVGGQIVKQGTGTQTISGTALKHTVLAQAGTLVLNGTYEIKDIAEGEHKTIYVDADDQESPNGGFMKNTGSLTVYTVNTEAGAQLNRGNAVFTYDGNVVTEDVQDGAYTLPSAPILSTVYVKNGSLAFAAFKAKAGETLTTVSLANNTTIVMDEAAIINLVMESGANATVNATAATTLNAVTGLTAAQQLVVSGDETVTLGSAVTGNKVVVDNGHLNLGALTHTLNELSVTNGTVDVAGVDNKYGCVSGIITIGESGTVTTIGHHDVFGYNDGSTDKIVMQGAEGKLAKLVLNSPNANSVTMTTDIEMYGYSAITSTKGDSDKGFNTYGGTITVNSVENSIDVLDMRNNGVTITVNADGELEIKKVTIFGNQHGENTILVKAGEGLLTLSGASNLSDGLNISAGTVAVGGATTIGNLAGTGDLVVKEGGSLNVTGSVTDTNITVENGGTIAGGVDAKNVGIEAGATATFDEGVIDEDAGISIVGWESGATVTNDGATTAKYAGLQDSNMTVAAEGLYSLAERDVDINNALEVGVIIHEGTGALTLTKVDEDALKVVSTDSADLTIKGITETSLTDLSIGTGATVAVYTDTQATLEGMVTVSETLTAGGATLLANLTIEASEGDAFQWDLGGTNMTLGSTLKLVTADGLIQLDDETMQNIADLQAHESYALVLDGAGDLTYIGEGWWDQVFTRSYGEGNGLVLTGDYQVGLLDNGNFGVTKLSNVPEPTTGTLSLLALAGLCARRRRK